LLTELLFFHQNIKIMDKKIEKFLEFNGKRISILLADRLSFRRFYWQAFDFFTTKKMSPHGLYNCRRSDNCSR